MKHASRSLRVLFAFRLIKLSRDSIKNLRLTALSSSMQQYQVTLFLMLLYLYVPKTNQEVSRVRILKLLSFI